MAPIPITGIPTIVLQAIPVGNLAGAAHARYRNSSTKWRTQAQAEEQIKIEKQSLDDYIARPTTTKRERARLRMCKSGLDYALHYLMSNRRPEEPVKAFSKLGESCSKLDANVSLAAAAISTAQAEKRVVDDARAERERISMVAVDARKEGAYQFVFPIVVEHVRTPPDDGTVYKALAIGAAGGLFVAGITIANKDRIQKKLKEYRLWT